MEPICRNCLALNQSVYGPKCRNPESPKNGERVPETYSCEFIQLKQPAPAPVDPKNPNIAKVVSPGAGLILPGIDSRTIEILEKAGYAHLTNLAGVTVEELEEIKGIGPKKAEQIMESLIDVV